MIILFLFIWILKISLYLLVGCFYYYFPGHLGWMLRVLFCYQRPLSRWESQRSASYSQISASERPLSTLLRCASRCSVPIQPARRLLPTTANITTTTTINVNGFESTNRRLLMTETQSVLLSGVKTWADALKNVTYLETISAGARRRQRRGALRIPSPYVRSLRTAILFIVAVVTVAPLQALGRRKSEIGKETATREGEKTCEMAEILGTTDSR